MSRWDAELGDAIVMGVGSRSGTKKRCAGAGAGPVGVSVEPVAVVSGDQKGDKKRDDGGVGEVGIGREKYVKRREEER